MSWIRLLFCSSCLLRSIAVRRFSSLAPQLSALLGLRPGTQRRSCPCSCLVYWPFCSCCSTHHPSHCFESWLFIKRRRMWLWSPSTTLYWLTLVAISLPKPVRRVSCTYPERPYPSRPPLCSFPCPQPQFDTETCFTSVFFPTASKVLSPVSTMPFSTNDIRFMSFWLISKAIKTVS